MGHQISKYPLTAAEVKERKLPPPPDLVPVVFVCGHKARIFSPGAADPVGILKEEYEQTHRAPELEQKCFTCVSSKR